jgi:hypothetical protein
MGSINLDSKVTTWGLLLQLNLIVFAILLELGFYSAIMAFILLAFNVSIKLKLLKEVNQC